LQIINQTNTAVEIHEFLVVLGARVHVVACVTILQIIMSIYECLLIWPPDLNCNHLGRMQKRSTKERIGFVANTLLR
jgi:hypothetical protein